jgi:preprotein translocase subunit SecG
MIVAMETTLSIIQIILSVLLVLSILLQQTGTGIDGALGGGSSSESITTTRRGAEKFLFYVTIVLAVLFAASAIIALVL